MTNILIDRNGKRYKIEMCKYCLDYKGQPKPILPEDMKHARKMSDGYYVQGLHKRAVVKIEFFDLLDDYIAVGGTRGASESNKTSGNQARRQKRSLL